MPGGSILKERPSAGRGWSWYELAISRGYAQLKTLLCNELSSENEFRIMPLRETFSECVFKEQNVRLTAISSEENQRLFSTKIDRQRAHRLL